MNRLERALDIGPKYAAELSRCGVRTIPDLAKADLPALSAQCGVPLPVLQQWHWQAVHKLRTSRYRRNAAIGIALVVTIALSWGLHSLAHSPARLLSRALALAEQHRYNDAVRVYSDAIARNPSLELAYANRAYSLHQLGRYAEALESINAAIALEPDHVWALDERASIYADQDKHELALADFDKSIAMDPNDRFAYAHRGMALRMLDRYPEAIASLSRAIELRPDYTWAYNERGNAYSDGNEPGKAIADYDAAIRLDPTYKYRYSKGSDLRKLGRFQEAVDALTKGINLDPKWEWAYEHRGLIYHDDLFQFEKAYQDMKKVCELRQCAPGDVENLAEAAFTAGRFQEARETSAKILDDYENASLKDFDVSSRLTARFYVIASLLLQRDVAQAKQRLGEFASYFKANESTLKRHWNYGGTRHYLDAQPPDPATKAVLTAMLNLLDEKQTGNIAGVEVAAAQLR